MSVSLNDKPNKVYSSGDTVTVTAGSGIQGPQGATGATGAGGTVAFFGNFFSTETQTNGSVSAKQTFTLNSTVDSNGVSIVDGTKITFAAGSDGTFDLQFSAQFDKTDSGTDEVDIWISKNGTDLEWSNTVLSLVGNNAKAVPAWNWQLNDVVGGDFFQLHWWSPDSDMRVLAVAAGSNPTRPAVPSIIVTVAQVTYTQAGAAGAAATVAVGTTTTGAAGTSASVVNAGTSSAAVLNFTIPRGDTGATGATGATGPEGGTSTLTTKGDLLTRTSSAVARLPVGATTGHVLTVDPAEATGMKWAASSGGIPETLIDAKGDLIVGSAADTAARLAVGTTNEHGLIVDSSATNGIAWGNVSPVMMRRVATYYYNGVPFDGGPAASTSTSANRMTFFPFYNPHKHTYSAAAVQVINNVASSNCRMGIYNDNNGEPGTLVIDFGAVSTATGGAKEIASSVTLSRGFYWAALLLDTAAVTFRTVGQGNNFTLGRSTNASVNPTFGGLAVVTYGALPDPAPSAVLGQAFTAGCIYLKA